MENGHHNFTEPEALDSKLVNSLTSHNTEKQNIVASESLELCFALLPNKMNKMNQLSKLTQFSVS